MTDSQVLTKAIERALEGGWKPWVVIGDSNPPISRSAIEIAKVANWAEIIFNIDFARALFGEYKKLPYSESKKLGYQGNARSIAVIDDIGWKYHIQKLAISPDRIAYLRDYMEEQQ